MFMQNCVKSTMSIAYVIENDKSNKKGLLLLLFAEETQHCISILTLRKNNDSTQVTSQRWS